MKYIITTCLLLFLIVVFTAAQEIPTIHEVLQQGIETDKNIRFKNTNITDESGVPGMFNSLVIGQFGASTYMRFIPYTTLDVPGSELWDWDHDFYYHFKNQQWGVDGDFHIEDNLILTGCIGIGTADPVGSLDISLLGSWKDKAKISFDRSGSNPVIKFYRPTGQDQYPDRVHSWWIENSGNGHLQFKSGLPSDIGMEEVNVKMHIGKNGEVGIGTTTPLGQFDIGFTESWNDKATISF